MSDDQPRLRTRARVACLAALQTLGGSASRADLVATARRDGAFTEHELTAPGRIASELSWALSALKREGLVENPARSRWQLAGPPAPERVAALRAMAHAEYLGVAAAHRTAPERPSVAPPGILVTAVSIAPPAPGGGFLARLRARR